MDLGLKGKRAIVTGATRGICRSLIEILAKEGADIAFCARKQDEVDATVEALKPYGTRIIGGTANVKDAEGYKAWLQKAAEELGGCDVFVPGVSAGGGMDGEKSWYKAFEIDLMGCVRGFDALFPTFKAQKSGNVVFISTTAAVETFIGPMAYNALKAALITYGKQLSQAHAKRGIRVNLVSPGPIMIEGGSWDQVREQDEAFFQSILAQQPDGRMGEADEVARAIAFLASDASSWINGVNLVVDGGFTKRVQF